MVYHLSPPEEHHEAIIHIDTIVQGIHMQSHDLEGLSQAKAFLTSSNTSVMEQLAHMTVTMNNMQAQLNILAAAQKN